MLGRLCHPFEAIFSSFRKNKRGNVAMTFAIAIIPIMMALGGGADYVLLQHVKTKTKAAADVAVLAAISPAVIYQDKTKQEILASVDEEVRKFFDFHIDRFDLTQNVTVKQFIPAAYTKDDRITIRLCYEGIVKTNFSGFASYDSFAYSDCVEATTGVALKYYDIYFIVDASTSMGFGATKQDQINIKNNDELQRLFYNASWKYDGGIREMYRVSGTTTDLRKDCTHICHLNNIPKVAEKYSSTIKTRLDIAKLNMINFVNTIDDAYFTSSRVRINIMRFSSAGFEFIKRGGKRGEPESHGQNPKFTTFRITSNNSNKKDLINKIKSINLDVTLFKNDDSRFWNTLVKGGGGTNFFSSFNYMIDNGFLTYLAPKDRIGEKNKPLKYVILVTDGVEDSKNAVSSGYGTGDERHSNALNGNAAFEDGGIYQKHVILPYFTWWTFRRPHEIPELPIKIDTGSSDTHRIQAMHDKLCEGIRSFGEFYILRMPHAFEDHRSMVSVPFKKYMLGGIKDDSATADNPLTRGIKACADAPKGEERVIYGDTANRLADLAKKIFPKPKPATLVW